MSGLNAEKGQHHIDIRKVITHVPPETAQEPAFSVVPTMIVGKVFDRFVSECLKDCLIVLRLSVVVDTARRVGALAMTRAISYFREDNWLAVMFVQLAPELNMLLPCTDF